MRTFENGKKTKSKCKQVIRVSSFEIKPLGKPISRNAGVQTELNKNEGWSKVENEDRILNVDYKMALQTKYNNLYH